MNTVTCILNNCDETTIPIENFMLLDDRKFDKSLIVFNKTKKELDQFLKINYPQIRVNAYGLGGLSLLGKFVKTRKIIKREKPEVIHAHHTLSALIAYFAKLNTIPLNFVLTVHNDFSKYKKLQKLIYGFLYAVSDALIANSYNTKDTIPGFDKAKVSVIYNGVNIRKLQNSVQENLACSFSFGTVARLVPQKDIKTLIAAFVVFKKDTARDGVKLYIVGDGYLKAKLIQYAKDQGVQNSVHFTGMLGREEV